MGSVSELLVGDRLRAAGCVLMAICVLGLSAGPAAADPAQYTQSATPLSQPTGAVAGDTVVYDEACGATDSCVAVGSYQLSSTEDLPFVDAIVDGKPLPAEPVSLPANAAPGPQTAYLDGVSCSSSGSCTAYGAYLSGGQEEPMVVQISAGVPATATEVTLPADSGPGGFTTLNGISCPSAGNCVLAGSYLNTTTNADTPLILSVVNGVPQPAVAVAPPADVDPDNRYGDFYGVACQSWSSCVAVGLYRGANDDAKPFIDQITAGVAHNAIATAVPADASTASPSAYLNYVACPAMGSCEAIGYYTDDAGHEANLVVPISGGTPGTATAVTPPSGAYGNRHEVELEGLSCSSAALCVAAGFDYYDAAYDERAALVTITPAGATAQTPALPANQYSGGPENSQFSDYGEDDGSAVSCAPAGPCLLDGYYQTAGDLLAGTLEQVSADGQIGSVQVAPAPADAGPNASPVPSGVACDGGGSCVVIGSYTGSGSNDEPYELSVQAPLTVAKTSLPGATQGTGYQAALGAGGVWGRYDWSVSSGALPLGLSLNAQTGVISGTPTAAGTSTFTVTVSAGGAPLQTASEQLSLVVAAAAGSATTPPTPTVTPSLEAARVRLLSASGKVSANRLRARLACSGAACGGTVKLELTRIVTVRKGKQRARKHETVVIGSARYTVAAGAARDVTVTLSGSGKEALAAAKRHRLEITVVASVRGGKQASRDETIYTAVKRRR
ncbi:MAG TPA: Ig domain-containing protein [Solirubrobacteraceae bacterium]|jgi:hypothetical protein|nr:Ig domain-containing protein [Solirubrobacteraceae bacterium]